MAPIVVGDAADGLARATKLAIACRQRRDLCVHSSTRREAPRPRPADQELARRDAHAETGSTPHAVHERDCGIQHQAVVACHHYFAGSVASPPWCYRIRAIPRDTSMCSFHARRARFAVATCCSTASRACPRCDPRHVLPSLSLRTDAFSRFRCVVIHITLASKTPRGSSTCTSSGFARH